MIRTIGYILQIVTGIFGAIVWFGTWMDWVPFFGFWLAILFTPGIVIFPFFYWLIEGHLPGLYLLIWSLGVIGTGIMFIGQMEHEIRDDY